jgi:hypothetical protein
VRKKAWISPLVVDDTNISPPFESEVIPAAIIAHLPQKSPDSLITSPVRTPIRTRIGTVLVPSAEMTSLGVNRA